MDKWCCTVDGSEIHLSNVEKPLQIVEIKLQGGPLPQRNQWELINPSTYTLTFLWRYAQNSTACFIYISFQLTTMCFCCVEFPYLCQIRQTIKMNILHWHWHVSGKNQYNYWTWIKGIFGDSLTKPQFKVTSADVVKICPNVYTLKIIWTPLSWTGDSRSIGCLFFGNFLPRKSRLTKLCLLVGLGLLEFILVREEAKTHISGTIVQSGPKEPLTVII